LITARTSSLAELAEATGLDTRDRGGDAAWDLADDRQSASFRGPGNLPKAVAMIAEASASPR
jgi:hypothetical protein